MPTHSLLPLLCAAILILLFSGCSRDIKPVNSGKSSAGEDSPETHVAEENAGASGSDNIGTTGKTLETSPDTPTGEPDAQSNEVGMKLQGLSGYLSVVSEVLNARPEDDTPELILSNAKQWLSDLKIQIDALTEASKTSDKFTEMDPKLKELTAHLGDMFWTVNDDIPNQLKQQNPPVSANIVQQLQNYVTKLQGTAQDLSTTYETEPPVPPNNTEASDAVSNRLDELSTSVEDIAQNVNTLLLRADTSANAKRPATIGIFGILSFVVSVVSLVFVIRLKSSVNDLKSQIAEDETSEETDTTEENPIEAIADKVADKVLSKIAERSHQTPASQPQSEQQQTPLQQSSPTQPAKQYFLVTNPTAPDGQTVYLQKKTTNSGDIWAYVNNNAQAYEIYPETTQTQNRGKSGYITRTRLTSGDVQKCFNTPKSLPAGERFFVTVTDPARIKWDGNQYVLKNSDRGKLSVIGAS